MERKYKKFFEKKVILITGGTGSFGKTFLKKIINFNCEIRIYSRDELKQNDLRNELNNNKVKFYIGDIRDKENLFKATIGVDYVFHAAALKQVPSCEFFPIEAVKTNIIGSKNLIDCCTKNNVKKIVFLSTDKAVYPINAMGMSKALMEKTLISESKIKSNSKTKMSIVRYGNVMFSRGSVIPLFIDQILKNKLITITDKEMTRFLLSLDDAINLVLFAVSSNDNGSIFIKKAPSCRIIDLAHVLNKIFNKKSKIKIIGKRHGEKIHETLVSSAELLTATEYSDYYKVPSDKRPLNYKSYYEVGIKKNLIYDYSSDKTKILNKNELEKLLLKFSEIKDLI